MATSWAITPPSGVESTYDYTTNTNVRDVSDVLDALYLADTPLVNRIGWGANCTNKVIEWITDDIGKGYIILSNGVDMASDASSFVCGTSGVGAVSLALRQIHTGTILKYNGNSDKSKGYLVVEDLSLGGGSVVVDFLSGTSVLVSDAATLFIVGSPVNEGSEPRNDTTRGRAIASNKTQIFRQDVRMTGTRMATQMYAVANELQKQISLRAKEYWRELERTVILGIKDSGSTTETQLMGGIYNFLKDESGSHIDTSTTTLTETAINDLCKAIWDNGGAPTTIVMGSKQARVIPTIDRARVRVEQDSKMAGFYVNKYLTDLGVTLDMLISRWVPDNFTFILEIDKLKLRPMAGRKYNLEKLGKKGDYVEYQLISELSLEFKGYNHGIHGMFTALT
jgi:hypothetical protein